MAVRLQETDFDIAAEVAALAHHGTETGAIVTFCGVCRGTESGDPISAIMLEHYPGMIEAEIERHIGMAKSRWALLDATVIHRYGRIEPGQNIVLVITAASHRHDAFAAAEFLTDYLKTRAPIWKREEREGTSRWIEARDADVEAAERWNEQAPRAPE
jgi:molybdopterin synthase catalytic subunit